MKLCTIGEGTSEIQRLVIARELLKAAVGLMDARGSPCWPRRRRGRWRARSASSRRTPHRRGAVLRGVFPPARAGPPSSGVTGSPGAGKSSLVDRLDRALARSAGGAWASWRSIRRARSPAARSWATACACRGTPSIPASSSAPWPRRGHLGGLSRAASDAVDLLDAAGYDPVLVETVGVGQDEIEIVRAADVVCVVLVPGMGDDIQAIKAGILEIADLFVINKADRAGADRLAADLDAMMALVPSAQARAPDRPARSPCRTRACWRCSTAWNLRRRPGEERRGAAPRGRAEIALPARCSPSGCCQARPGQGPAGRRARRDRRWTAIAERRIDPYTPRRRC